MAHSRLALALLIASTIFASFAPVASSAAPDPNPWPQPDALMEEARVLFEATNASLAIHVNDSAYTQAFESLTAARRGIRLNSFADVSDNLVGARLKLAWLELQPAARAAETEAPDSGHRDYIIQETSRVYNESLVASNATRAALREAATEMTSLAGIDYLYLAALVHTQATDYSQAFEDRLSGFRTFAAVYDAKHPSYLGEAEKVANIPFGAKFLHELALDLTALAKRVDAASPEPAVPDGSVARVADAVYATIQRSPSSGPIGDARHLSRGRAAYADANPLLTFAEFSRYRDANAAAGNGQLNEANDATVRARLVDEFSNVTKRMYGQVTNASANLTAIGYPLVSVRDATARVATNVDTRVYGTLLENHARLSGILARIAILEDLLKTTPATPNSEPTGPTPSESSNTGIVTLLIVVAGGSFGVAWWMMRK